ncbi:MAG TPA: ATP-dependent RecD-like DNA helicase [Opitutaceae bacterium]
MPNPPETSALTGVVERIIFLNEENHYTIAEFRPDTSAKAEAVTIVGALPGVECGETLHLSGEWTRHSQHGDQFKVASFRSELPASVYGIRKYLGSGLVPGIGRVYANKIVDAFGTDTFRVLSEESGRLRTVPGIGRKRVAAIKQAWDEKRTERELYIFLQTYGVSPSQCVKLVRHYGPQAKAVLTGEPYRVAREIEGIGFRTADRIAINLGFANDAAPRLDAGILYAMETLQEDGHTAFGADDLRGHAAGLLETSADLVAARIAALVDSKALVRHETGGQALVQLPVNERAERKIADSSARIRKVASGLPAIRVDAALEWAQSKAGFRFHDLQSQAVRAALTNKFSVLTGGPGTGKTSALRSLVSILKAKGVRVHLAAPTGRAAQRLAETTGGFASTIHRLLKFDPAAGFTANESHPLATDFLIVDEASMLDTRLAAALMQAVPSRAHLLLVGDTDQLPSVGAGNVLQDLIASSGAPVTRLSVIFRQEGQSGIVTAAHAINSGETFLPRVVQDVDAIEPGDDITFVAATNAEDCVRKVTRLCAEFIPRAYRGCNPRTDVQVMAPMHKGVAGVANLNLELQAALNGSSRGIGTASGEFRPGDKVIQLRNNYDKNLFNGDIGSVKAVDTGAGQVTADFDGERHSFTRAELGDLALAYAISIHKSQGSEYPVVVVPLLKAHFMMLQRNLLYTAVTRGRKRVFLVGEAAAYAMAVRNGESKLRITHLRQKLAAP